MSVKAALKSAARRMTPSGWGREQSAGSPAKADAEYELTALLDAMEDVAAERLAEWSGVYRDGRNYVFGNQLADTLVKEGWERIQLNKVFPAITQEQALLTQRRVTIKALPFEEGDADGSKLWEPVLQWQFDKGLDVPGVAILAIEDGKTHGHWVGKVWWDKFASWNAEDSKWVGQLRLSLLRPEHVYVHSSNDNSHDPDEAEYVVEYERIRLDELKRRYPESVKQIDEVAAKGPIRGPQAAGQESAAESIIGTYPSDWQTSTSFTTGTEQAKAAAAREARLVGLLDADNEVSDVGRTTLPGDGREVWVAHFYLRDRTTETRSIVDHRYTGDELIEQGKAILQPDSELGAEGEAMGIEAPMVYIDTATGEPITEAEWPEERREVEAPAYQSYRYICRLSDVVLEDAAWPFEDHPYAVGVNHPLPHTTHGLNGVELVRCLQDIVNSLGKHFANYIENFSDPITKVEEGAVQNCPDNENVSEHIRAGPGAIWKLQPGAIAAQKIARESSPSISPIVLELYRIFTDQLEDVTGVHDIAMGRQGAQMTATQSLSLETNTKLRPGLQWVLMQAWYLRVVNRAAAMDREYMEPGQRVRIAGEGSVRMMELDATQFDAKYDLRLQVATDLPFDRDTRKNEARELYEILGIPFLEQLLDAYERKDKDEILANAQAYQAMVAAVEALKAREEEVAEQWRQNKRNPVTGEVDAKDSNASEGAGGEGGAAPPAQNRSAAPAS